MLGSEPLASSRLATRPPRPKISHPRKSTRGSAEARLPHPHTPPPFLLHDERNWRILAMSERGAPE